jgi:SAM-dependent methyltransferase
MSDKNHVHEPHSEHHHHRADDRHGAKQPERFDPARAALLDDPARLDYLPPAPLFELLDAPTGGLVVDFGTGTGTYAIELARRRPDLQIIALDEQPEMLKMLTAKPAAAQLKNLKAVLTSEHPDLDGKADRVLALNVLHELSDEALHGLTALLKRAGVALFADWNAEVDRPVGPPRDHVYTPAQALARLEKSGLACTLQPALRYHFVIVAKRAT